MQLVQLAFKLSLGIWLFILSMGWSLSDIRNTKHNLTQVAPELRMQQKEKEVCVFCHTPTAAMIGEDGKLVSPLWQKVTGEHSFITYDDIGKAGSPDAEDTVGSQSVACLSCHDASQAFGVTNMMSLDHPFGVPYRGSVLKRKGEEVIPLASQETTGIRRFARTVLNDSFKPATSGKVGQRKVWWVSSDNPYGTRRGKNDLPLYLRTSGESDTMADVEPQIECSSCHDPHTENQLFLRITESGKLCLTCHDK